MQSSRQKRWSRIFVAGILLGFSAKALSSESGRGPEFFVAVNGNDSWSGRLAVPNSAGTDGPFASIDRARDAARAASKGSSNSAPATILLRAGVYRLEHTLALGADDSGLSHAAPFALRSYRNESVHIVGGKAVSGWQPVRDEATLQRLDPSARGNVLQTDLRAQGIGDFGEITARGFGRPVTPAALELFFQDRPMTLARWPNGETWATIKGAPKGAEGGVFTVDSDRLARWTKAEDAWVHGYWTFDWADTYAKVAAVDPETHSITTVAPHGVYGYAPGRRFYALNILEELDTPGEYYLDRKTGILYFWPPTPITAGSTVVSLLSAPLISLNGASYISISGITMEDTRGIAIEMIGCTDCLVAGCTIRNIGSNGIGISGGSHCGVQSCDIYEVGDSGVYLSGGDRKTLQPAGHFVDNCEIHHQSRWDRTYRPAIGIDGVGNRASHNRIHDGPHNAILMGGNDHIVEFNDIYRVCTQTGDAGAVYMGRDLVQRGTVVRYNHFHDIGPTINAKEEGRYTEVMAVYLDDCFCGVTILGNLFERAGRSIMVGGGRDNTIQNNVFVDCNPDIHVDQRGKSWAARYFLPGSEWMILEHVKDVPYDQSPYTPKYPHLASILSDDPSAAKYNKIANNIHWGKGKWIDWLDGLNEKTVETTGNWTDGDPGFVSAAAQDYRLKSDAAVLKTGFKQLPLSRIGLQKDSYRKSIPPAD